MSAATVAVPVDSLAVAGQGCIVSALVSPSIAVVDAVSVGGNLDASA
jgi:hypothetical protein